MGTGVAVITPFREDRTVDFKSLGKLLQHLLTNHVDYLLILGTTGEPATLSKDEKRAVIDYASEVVNHKVPIMVGFGGNNTSEVIKSIHEHGTEGIDGVLSICPYYNKPNQTGIYEHFKAIAEECPVPLVVYNVPGRTGVNIAADTTLRLAHDFKNIIAIKEASGNLDQIMQVIKNKPEHFEVISGDDLLTLPIIAAGGIGVISVTANAFPAEVSEMVKLALSQKIKQAAVIHYKLMDMTRALFAEGSPAGVKAVLHQMDIIQNYLRLPLTPVSKTLYDKLSELSGKILSR